MASSIQKVSDKVIDVFEKCSSTASRAGSTVERVGKMVESGVPRKAIAFVMTDRSTNNINWTEEKVGIVYDIYQESKTKVLVTASQATALANEYASNAQDDLDDDAVTSPA
jgi:hypothetical protein